jgi:inositol transport system permease protein
MKGPGAERLRGWLARYGLVLALVVIAAALAVAKPGFLSPLNLLTVLKQISLNGILAIGVTVVLLTGGVDLSLGSLVALTGVVAAHFAHAAFVPVGAGGTEMTPTGFREYPLVVPVALGVMAGAACGAANGLVVTLGRVAPFIVTLGTMTAARGLAEVLSGGKPVSTLRPAFTAIGGGTLLGVPSQIWILAAVALAAHVVLQRTRHGRYVYAVGGNEAAAHAAGLPVGRIKMGAYVVCGALAGLAGVILASDIQSGQPNEGWGFELDAIAAAVIGGTSLAGGAGGVGGTLLGALLMGVLDNGLDLMGASTYYKKIVKGAIIVGAAWMDRSWKGGRRNGGMP